MVRFRLFDLNEAYFFLVLVGSFLTSGCQLDLQVRDLSSGGALEVVHACPSSIYQTFDLDCTLKLSGPIQQSRLRWKLSGKSTCEWVSLDPETGQITGTPGTVQKGACSVAFSVNESDRFVLESSIELRVDSLETGFGGKTLGIYVNGDLAYFAKGLRGIEIYDINDPQQLTLVGWYNTKGNARKVAVDGNFLFVADYENGLVILDVSDPASPIWVSRYDSASANIVDVKISGSYAYLAAQTAGTFILDVSNRSKPSLLGSYLNPGGAYAIAGGDRTSLYQKTSMG